VIPAASGSRGSPSESVGVDRAFVRPEPGLADALPPAAIPPRSAPSPGTLARLAAGALIAGSLVAGFGLDQGMTVGLLDLLLGGSLVMLLILFRRFRPTRERSRPTHINTSSTVAAQIDRPTTEQSFGAGSSLERGLADIRRTDPRFDPTRLAGYTGMLFRDAQAAWASQDIQALRDRVTPAMYLELQAQSARLRKLGQADRVERIEVTAKVTEAWQENDRDYVTACIDGSTIAYTVDGVTDALIHGSRTVPRDIEEFWTFTRPAGLNFWMLSAIRTA
jgi:predicted lipid-binding transport protein (Tim44 family)